MSLVLGVLGGMGPAATLDFLTKLQAFTGAKREQDHIRVIADINPSTGISAPIRARPATRPAWVPALPVAVMMRSITTP